MDEAESITNLVTPIEGFTLCKVFMIRGDVHARREGDSLRGYVYLGSNVVFTYESRADQFPAGIEDFAAYTLRTFAKRLASLL